MGRLTKEKNNFGQTKSNIFPLLMVVGYFCEDRIPLRFKWPETETISGETRVARKKVFLKVVGNEKLGVYGSRYIQLPLIENSFNGYQGHPPLCLSPRTAQRIPDRIQTMF
jgi:hypothetical protein